MEIVFIGSLLFFVAILYASVGHGGASGYLAVLAFFHFTHPQMASSALVLNLIVAGIAWITYHRAHYFSWQPVAPFLIGSIPMAFLGGVLHISPELYGGILGGVLCFVAYRLAIPQGMQRTTSPQYPPPWGIACAIGGAIGLLSGMVGVGGGIFLSPLLLLLRWASVKQTAALSACFIWINSLSGLLGRHVGGNLDLTLVLPFILPAFLGGLLGAQLGAKKFSSQRLCRTLALVLLIAAFKAFRLALGG